MNAAIAEESASASEELSAQATSLDDMVKELVILVEGKERKAASSQYRGAQPVKARIVAPPPPPAPSAKKSAMKVIAPAQAIPLAEDERF